MAISKTHQLSEKGPRCGTLSHIPPEVFRDINKKGTKEEDVYAFAVTLWEIFSGLAPYARKMLEHFVNLIFTKNMIIAVWSYLKCVKLYLLGFPKRNPKV